MGEHALGRAATSPAVFVEAVLAHPVSGCELAASTLVEFADVTRRFALFLERGLGVVDISEVGQAEVGAFIRSRRADGGRPSVSLMHNRRTVCRWLFRTARTFGLGLSDPTAGLELPRREPVPPRPLTEDEVVRCRSYSFFHPSDLRHPMAWALAEATARTHEIARALIGDVDIARARVSLGGSPRSDPRTVPLTDWGLTQVQRRLRDSSLGSEDILVPFQSRKVPRASASMTVIEIFRAAGIRGADVRPISVVAWRGARAYADGASIEEVAALLGMRSLDRTAVLIGFEPGKT